MTELSRRPVHSNLSDPSFFKSRNSRSKLSEPAQEQAEPDSLHEEPVSVLVHEQTAGDF